MIKIKVLPAGHGDCIFITFSDSINERHIMVDGGVGREASRMLRKEMALLNESGQAIDLLVVTHIDADHISGVLGLFGDNEFNPEIIKDVWFNSGSMISKFLETDSDSNQDRQVSVPVIGDRRMSVKQGVTLEQRLSACGIWNQSVIMRLMRLTIDDAAITVLSPSYEGLQKLNSAWSIETSDERKMASHGTDYHITVEELLNHDECEDTSIPNMSSIAFLVSVHGKNILMLGDSHANVIAQSLRDLGYHEANKLPVDLLKLSHHASKANTTNELLQLVSCNNYVISTNGAKHGLPHKECLVRIIQNCNGPINFYFNYDIPGVFSREELQRYQVSILSLRQMDYSIVLGV